MKKFLIFLLAILVCGVLCACDSEEPLETPDNDNPPIQNESDKTSKVNPQEVYTFTLGTESLYVHAPMEDLAESLGEPTSYFESQSCAFQGLDKVYTYGSVIVRTYPEDDNDFILSIELKDDSVTTDEGVCIGDTKDTVLSVYGEAAEENDSSLVYKKGESTLTFIFDGEEVSAITYL